MYFFFNYSQISPCCWPELKRWQRFFLPLTVTTNTPRWTFQLRCSDWSFSTFSNTSPPLPSGDHEVPAWRLHTGKTVLVVVRFVGKTQLEFRIILHCSLEAPKRPGAPSLTSSLWTPGSLCSLQMGRCWDKWTRYEKCPLWWGFDKACKFLSHSRSFWTQNTGKLRIGTYTGDLQHGTVYSGGEVQPDGSPHL